MGKHALVIDDSLTVRSMVGVAFKRLGWESTVAKDASDALEKLAAQSFDMIVTDINMPGMNGIELIAKIRENPAYKKTPILALTTEGGNDTKNKGRAAGANGWMVKPFKPDVLEAAVAKLCGE